MGHWIVLNKHLYKQQCLYKQQSSIEKTQFLEISVCLSLVYTCVKHEVP